MWKKKEKYDELDTRSLIVNKKSDEFRGVGWAFLVLFLIAILVLYKN